MGKGLPYSNKRGNPTAVPQVRRVTYPVNNLEITVTAGASTALGFGTVVLGDFPEGNILYLGGISYLQFSTADTDALAAWDGDYSLGTTATADTTLDGTDVNLVASSAIGPATARVSPVARGASAADASEVFNNTDGTLEINLNMITDDNSITDSLAATFTVNGYVELVYIVLGDD
jgi:hypothetical protein